MHAKRDDLKDSFYLHIMRSSIGTGLRSQYAPEGNMPDRLAKLLEQLDSVADRGVEGEAVEKGEENPEPAQKHIQKKSCDAG